MEIMSQCYQENIDDIEFLQSLVYDQRIEYPINQTDLLFLDLSGDDSREYPLVYPVGYQRDGSIKKIKDEGNTEAMIRRFARRESIQKKVDSSEFELFCIENPRKPEKIRESFNNINWYPEGITLGKAMEKGADAVRKYYNDKNIRKRSKK